MEQRFNIRDQHNFPKIEAIMRNKKDVGNLLSAIPSWALFTLIVISHTLIMAVGNYIGYQQFLSGIPQPAPPTDAAVGSVLALLAFMLGFVFSSTWTRFEKRKLYPYSSKSIIVLRALFRQ